MTGDESITSAWADLVGIEPVPVRFDMPRVIAGPLNAAYLPDIQLIATTPDLAASLPEPALEAVLAHEFGHAVQDAVGTDMEAGSQKKEDGADAISGVLTRSADGAREAFRFLASRIIGDTREDFGARVTRIAKWAAWARSKSDLERKAEVLSLARGETNP
jgi:hypothetical protein